MWLYLYKDLHIYVNMHAQCEWIAVMKMQTRIVAFGHVIRITLSLAFTCHCMYTKIYIHKKICKFNASKWQWWRSRRLSSHSCVLSAWLIHRHAYVNIHTLKIYICVSIYIQSECVVVIKMQAPIVAFMCDKQNCVAVCCSVLQCAAVRCSVLQCVAVCCSVLQWVAVCCSRPLSSNSYVWWAWLIHWHCVRTSHGTIPKIHSCLDAQVMTRYTSHGTMKNEVCYSVLQCVAVCCSVLQCVAVCHARVMTTCTSHGTMKNEVCCSVLQCVAVSCSMLQCVAVCDARVITTCTSHGTMKCVAVCCSVLQCVAICCSVLQYVTVCCIVLQCVAVCCRVLTCASKHGLFLLLQPFS